MNKRKRLLLRGVRTADGRHPGETGLAMWKRFARAGGTKARGSSAPTLSQHYPHMFRKMARTLPRGQRGGH